jgi:hypothetical protein
MAPTFQERSVGRFALARMAVIEMLRTGWLCRPPWFLSSGSIQESFHV